VSKDGNLEVWAKDLEDGSKAVGLFNRNDTNTTVTAKWSDLGIHGPRMVRDLWRQQDLGKFGGQFQVPVPPHGVVLVKVLPLSLTAREMQSAWHGYPLD
jgi:alpha-galactosidase